MWPGLAMGPAPAYRGSKMAIQPETLNALLRAYEVHTGVYKNYHSRTAIVVKVSKEGKVHYLHMAADAKIVLEARDAKSFLAEFYIELYHYPVLRAVRSYARAVRTYHFAVTEEARKVINAILTR
jgi:hypothetical protein